MFALLGVLLVLFTPGPQTGSPVPGQSRSPGAPSFFAVSYVEAMASSTAQAIAFLKQYRTASASQDGSIVVEVFEQIGRPGHFAVVEAWRDQASFEARNAAIQKPLLDGLEPIRVSGYDQRPYKALTVADVPAPKARRGRAGEIVVITHVDVLPNPRVATMLTDLAELSRQEPGNVRFDVVQHATRANHFTVVEVWRDQRALDAHAAALHTRRYRDALQPLTGSPLDERIYRAIE